MDSRSMGVDSRSMGVDSLRSGRQLLELRLQLSLQGVDSCSARVDSRSVGVDSCSAGVDSRSGRVDSLPVGAGHEVHAVAAGHVDVAEGGQLHLDGRGAEAVLALLLDAHLCRQQPLRAAQEPARAAIRGGQAPE
eukprot:185738-Prorocentrum_minimum.AAC.5